MNRLSLLLELSFDDTCHRPFEEEFLSMIVRLRQRVSERIGRSMANQSEASGKSRHWRAQPEVTCIS